MQESEMRLHRCCFSGHRPEKLEMPVGFVQSWLECMIDAAIEDGYTTFITGMARGVDLWAASIVLQRRNENDKLKLICALPYQAMSVSWSERWQNEYQSILRRANLQHVINAGWKPGIYQSRNEWMVDHSSRLILVYNGIPSGTQNTLAYALEKNIDISALISIKQMTPKQKSCVGAILNESPQSSPSPAP